MLNRLLAIILLLSIVSSSFTRFIVYAGFKANEDYISKVLCENKSRPLMHCNGRCYLMKKLKQAEEKEKNQERQAKGAKHQEALPVVLLTKSALSTEVDSGTYPAYLAPRIEKVSATIFQPPKVG
jgi:hypothetical protein